MSKCEIKIDICSSIAMTPNILFKPFEKELIYKVVDSNSKSLIYEISSKKNLTDKIILEFDHIPSHYKQDKIFGMDIVQYMKMKSDIFDQIPEELYDSILNGLVLDEKLFEFRLEKPKLFSKLFHEINPAYIILNRFKGQPIYKSQVKHNDKINPELQLITTNSIAKAMKDYNVINTNKIEIIKDVKSAYDCLTYVHNDKSRFVSFVDKENLN